MYILPGSRGGGRWAPVCDVRILTIEEQCGECEREYCGN